MAYLLNGSKLGVAEKEHIRLIHNPGLQAGIFWPAYNLYFSLNGISYAQQQKHHLPSKFPSILNETEENQRKNMETFALLQIFHTFAPRKAKWLLARSI